MLTTKRTGEKKRNLAVGLLLLSITVALSIWLFWPTPDKPLADSCLSVQCHKDIEYINNFNQQKYAKELAEFNRPKQGIIHTTTGDVLCKQLGLNMECMLSRVATTTVISVDFATTTLPMNPEIDMYFRGMGVSGRLRDAYLAKGQCPFNLFCPTPSTDEFVAEYRKSLESSLKP